MLGIVSATRLIHDDFWYASALGISLRRLNDRRIIPYIAYENTASLALFYNKCIQTADKNAIMMVFMHDDVWIDDYFCADRLIEGLQKYDVIGVAGNRRRVANQPAWAFIDNALTRDEENLSGAIAHGEQPCGKVSFYGGTPADVELLDGVFMAANRSALLEKEVLFDPRFSFHFYDMDFCRTARQHGLTLGTWPICLTHQSSGSFGAGEWEKGYRLYTEKWKD